MQSGGPPALGDGIDVNLQPIADVSDFDMACAYLDAHTDGPVGPRGEPLPLLPVSSASTCPLKPEYSMGMPPPAMGGPVCQPRYAVMGPPLPSPRRYDPLARDSPALGGPFIRTLSTESTGSQNSAGGTTTSLGSASDCMSERSGGGKRKSGVPKTKTAEQVEKIRERNRILARRTRLRKKQIYESLQKQVTELKRENSALKSKMCRSQRSDSVVSTDKDEVETLAGSSGMLGDDELALAGLALTDSTMRRLARTTQHTFCITDPNQPARPLVYASQSFLRVTGYQPEQLYGRDLRFLSGPFTEASVAEQIFKAVDQGVEATHCMQVQRADGGALWAQLYVSPLHNRAGKTVQTIVALCPLDGPPLEDDDMDHDHDHDHDDDLDHEDL